jgi:hypothetical protein
VIVSIFGSAGSFFTKSLPGIPVMIGSVQGTALVILVVATPILAASTILAIRGIGLAQVSWLGSLSYILYNSILLLFALPFNTFFLVYVAMVSLSFWSLVALLKGFDIKQFETLSKTKTSLKVVSIYLLIVTAFFYFQELSQYIPASINNAAPSSYLGTGLLTNPSHAIDLAFALPLATLSAIWIWQKKTWGNTIGGSFLIMFTIESVSIASVQFFGILQTPPQQWSH